MRALRYTATLFVCLFAYDRLSITLQRIISHCGRQLDIARVISNETASRVEFDCARKSVSKRGEAIRTRSCQTKALIDNQSIINCSRPDSICSIRCSHFSASQTTRARSAPLARQTSEAERSRDTPNGNTK